MTLLLTGATGFLGSHLLKALCREKYDVAILKRSTSDIWRVRDVIGRCRVYDIDRTTEKTVFEQEKIDVIIHCATVYGREGGSSAKVVDTNLSFPLRLMETAIRAHCKYFINTDTFFCKQLPERLEEGKPLCLPDYTLSKFQFREWGKTKAAEGQINFINLQLEHIYGDGDGAGKFIPWLEKQFRDGAEYVDLTDGIQLRDFVDVEDVVSAYLRVLKDLPQLQGYQSFEVGTGETMSVRRFVEELKERHQAATELRFGKIPRKDNEIMYSTAAKDSPYLSGVLSAKMQG